MAKAILVKPATKEEIVQNLWMLLRDAKRRKKEAAEELKAASDAYLYIKKEIAEIEQELDAVLGEIKKEEN